jgi:hypothetical protein
MRERIVDLACFAYPLAVLFHFARSTDVHTYICTYICIYEYVTGIQRSCGEVSTGVSGDTWASRCWLSPNRTRELVEAFSFLFFFSLQ